MTRIFYICALAAVALVALATIIGLSLGDLQATLREIQTLQIEQEKLSGEGQGSSNPQLDELAARSKELREIEPWARMHRLAGVAAALVVVLVYSIVVTYFIGTSRWCKEVVEAYRLPQELAREATQIKRRAFAWALIGMLWAVGLVALGAAADPATGRAGTSAWVTPHLVAAMATFVWLAWSFTTLYGHILRQNDVIQRIMTEVRAARESRGLEV
jgi:heme exporter protein D